MRSPGLLAVQGSVVGERDWKRRIPPTRSQWRVTMVRSVPSRRCPIGWRRRGPVAAVLLLGSFLAVPGGTAHGQDPGPGAVERLAPDRPGFSTGTHTVTPGRIYLEVGIGHSLARGEAVSETQAPQATVRTGVLPGLEVFVEWEGWTRSRDGEPVSAAGPALGTRSACWIRRGSP